MERAMERVSRATRGTKHISMRFVGIVFLLLAPLAFADDLVDGEGVNLVRGHCSACHSLSIVTSQRGDRQYWLNLIRWMQATQNLWQIPKEHEEAILTYLAKHYAETEWGRRPNLPPSLIGKKQELGKR